MGVPTLALPSELGGNVVGETPMLPLPGVRDRRIHENPETVMRG